MVVKMIYLMFITSLEMKRYEAKLYEFSTLVRVSKDQEVGEQNILENWENSSLTH